MFCKHCGTKLADDAMFCPVCGAKVNDATATGEKDEFFQEVPTPSQNQQPTYTPQQPTYAPQQNYYAQPAKTNTMAIVGFVLSFFVALAGLICSIIGMKQCNETKEGGKGFAVAGIVISAVSMALSFLIVIIVFATVGSYPGYYY